MAELLRIKEAASDRNMTLSMLAEKMGITKGSLSLAIHGNPTISYLSRIADALGCTVKDLIR